MDLLSLRMPPSDRRCGTRPADRRCTKPSDRLCTRPADRLCTRLADRRCTRLSPMWTADAADGDPTRRMRTVT